MSDKRTGCAPPLESIISEASIETNGGTLLNELARMLFVVAARPHIEARVNRKDMSSDLNDESDIDRVLDMLHQSPEKMWTIGRLASEVSMSRTALAIKFRDTVGETLFAYLTRYRIDCAKALLLSGIPTKQVCKLVGYNSETAFARAFGRVNGVTPQGYRKSAVSRASVSKSNRTAMTGVYKDFCMDAVVVSEASDVLNIQSLYCIAVNQELLGFFPNYMDAVKVSRILVGLKDKIVIRPISEGRLSVAHWNRAPLLGVSHA